MHQATRRSLALAFWTAALAACAESPTAPPQPELSTGLHTLESEVPPNGEAIDANSQERLDLIAQALKHGSVSVDGQSPRTPRTPPKDPREAEPVLEVEPDAPLPESLADEPPAASAAPTPSAPSREALVAELAAQLREQARSTSAPAAALLRLASLELLESKAGATDPAAEAALTPQESEFLAAWRELFAAAREGLNSTGDLAPLTERVVALAERVQASQPLATPESRLCVRVDGFGMFDEMKRRESDGPYIFVAGKRHRAIVYIEVLNFTHTEREQRGVNGFEVRLAQELELFHAASEADTVVWRRPFQEINDFSRKRRRDFYTTQIIDLPANLGVGAYRLKVTMSDRTSGAIAESIIPIELVAESRP